MNTNNENASWGNAQPLDRPHDYFRMLSKNVGTINSTSLDMVAIATSLQEVNASIFLAQEMNTPWTPENLHCIAQQCHQVYQHKKIATSSSQEKCKGNHQPGGTMTLALGKWASRIIDQGCDKHLGRWSNLELVGQHGKCIILISAYCVCAQEFDATSNTATAQQTRLLQKLGIPNPNPQKQFIRDLIQQLQEWHTKGKEIILGMDANEDIDHLQSEIMQVFNETDLIDLHHHCYPAMPKPATHQWGSCPINLLAGTPMCASTIHCAWILPFGMPPTIKGDHHLLGLDFDMDILFGNSPTNPMPTPQRGVNSKHKLHVARFCKETIADCNKHQIAACINILKEKSQLSDADLHEYPGVSQPPLPSSQQYPMVSDCSASLPVPLILVAATHGLPHSTKPPRSSPSS